jgi:hypothetical protein
MESNININNKINLLYDFVYNQNTKNCFSLDKIILGKIGLDDIKITIPNLNDNDENEYYELNKKNVLEGKFRVLSFDEVNNQIYLKKYSDQFPITVKISFYKTNDKIDDLFNSPINNDSLFSYILSELVLYKKTKHICLPLINIDVKNFDIEKIIGDDTYYNTIKNLIKNNIIQDVCCLQLREHFFKSTNLYDYLTENKCVYKALLFQVIHTLAVLQKNFNGFRHNNLTLKNILIYLKKNEDIYTEYDGFKDDKFYLPNYGFDIKIFNFEKSTITKYYEIEKKELNQYYDLYTFMNDLVLFKTINDCDKETSNFFDKYLPSNIRNNFKDNIEIVKPINLLYDKYFDSFKNKSGDKKNISINNHQYMTGKNKFIETFINSDNYSILGKQDKIKSNINIMMNKRIIKKDNHTSIKINRIEVDLFNTQVGGFEKPPYTNVKNTPFVSNDERATTNKKKMENPVKEPAVLLEQKIYDNSVKPEKKQDFPPPYIPLYDQKTGDVTAQMYPYSNIIGQQPIQQKLYNITLSNPIGPHTTINRIYEDMIPGEPQIYSALTIYERSQLTNFIRNTIIDNHDGEDMDISGGKNSLLSFIKVMECNPYSTKQNPYHDLPRDFLLYRAAYPIRYNSDKANIDIAKKSMGMNVRMYKMTIGAMKCRSISEKIDQENFDLWREIAYYTWVKDDIIKKKISPNFVSSYLYKIDTRSRIDWEKLQLIKKKVQIDSVTNSLIKNQQKINGLHSIRKALGQLSLILPQTKPESNKKAEYNDKIIQLEEKYKNQIDKINGIYKGTDRDDVLRAAKEEYTQQKNYLKILYKDIKDIELNDDISLDSKKVLILLTEAPTSNILHWSGPIYEKFGTIRKMTSTGYHTPAVWRSIIFQLVYACAVLQKSDIYMENFSLENNIFIKDIFTDYNSIGSWIYRVNNVNYYIPNYGYVLMVDSKYSDIDTSEEKDEQQFKIYGKIYKKNSIYNDPNKRKQKLIDQFKNVINPDNFRHKLVVDGGGHIDKVIDNLLEDLYNATNSIKDISSLIPIYFSEFVHNRVGTLLLKSEKDNINKLSRPNFYNNRGKLMVYQRRFDEYEWAIFLEDLSESRKKIITNDSISPIIEVFSGSLFGYPDNEIIVPETKNNLKYDENNIYETYNLDNI